jgi:hypothetical protein
VSEHNDHDGAEVLYRILETAYGGRIGAIAGYSDYEEIAQPLIENNLRRDSAVGATQDRH